MYFSKYLFHNGDPLKYRIHILCVLFIYIYIYHIYDFSLPLFC